MPILESILSGLIGAGIKKLFEKTFTEKVIEGTLLVLAIAFTLAVIGGICYGIYELFIWLKYLFVGGVIGDNITNDTIQNASLVNTKVNETGLNNTSVAISNITNDTLQNTSSTNTTLLGGIGETIVTLLATVGGIVGGGAIVGAIIIGVMVALTILSIAVIDIVGTLILAVSLAVIGGAGYGIYELAIWLKHSFFS